MSADEMDRAEPSGIWRALLAYPAHRDPRTADANFVALLVASNQPFYPLYLYATVSETIGPSAVTFLSTPLFLAVPAVARHNPLWGRGLLVLAGIANTMACAKAFGVASGVEVFLIPCLILALLLFRPAEWRVAYGLAATGFAVGFGLHSHYGAPLHTYTPAEYEAFARLNFLSVAALSALIAHRFASLLNAAEEERRN